MFVHGLYGDRDATWTSENGVFWPKKFLSQDMQEARISTFGYDANVVVLKKPLSDSTLENHADSLIAALAGMRDKTETVRFDCAATHEQQD